MLFFRQAVSGMKWEHYIRFVSFYCRSSIATGPYISGAKISDSRQAFYANPIHRTTRVTPPQTQSLLTQQYLKVNHSICCQANVKALLRGQGRGRVETSCVTRFGTHIKRRSRDHGWIEALILKHHK